MSETDKDHWQRQLENIEQLASEASEAWSEDDRQTALQALQEMDGRITTVLEDATFLMTDGGPGQAGKERNVPRKKTSGRCDMGDCYRPASRVVTHDTVEGQKRRRYCEKHVELVLRSENATLGIPGGESA